MYNFKRSFECLILTLCMICVINKVQRALMPSTYLSLLYYYFIIHMYVDINSYVQAVAIIQCKRLAGEILTK